MAGRTMEPFQPSIGGTTTVAATAATVSTAVNTTTPGAVTGQVLVTNAGTTLVFVRMSRENSAASAADTPVLPNDRFVLSTGAVTGDTFYVNVICPGGTSTVYLTRGFGI